MVEEVPAPPEEPVVELGEPTAFCIQLFCIDERYEMRSIDFMAEAFKRFPVSSICLILHFEISVHFYLNSEVLKV